ncbi:hypothetical protein L9F63_006538, partial [Diploptera punctata]
SSHYCRFSLSRTRGKWLRSVCKKILVMKSGSAPRRSSIVLANSTRFGMSFGSRRCTNCTLYACSLRLPAKLFLMTSGGFAQMRLEHLLPFHRMLCDHHHASSTQIL